MVASDGWSPFEQRLAVLELADRARGRVEAERQLVAVGPQPRQQERITAHVGRDVDARIVRKTGRVEEGVRALVQTHQGQRNRIAADREDDRVVALQQAELVHGDRHSVRNAHLRGAFDAADLHVAVLARVQGLELIVEKRQFLCGRCGRHIAGLSWVPARARSRVCHRPMKSCAALYARAMGFASAVSHGPAFTHGPDNSLIVQRDDPKACNTGDTIA